MIKVRIQNESMKATAVLETCLYADDLTTAEKFYTDVMGLEVYARQPERHVFFRCGAQMVLIFNARTTSAEPNGHGGSSNGHVAFAIREDEIPAWREWLKFKNVNIDSEVTWPNGGLSIYFKDPAGNHLEVATRKLWGIPEAS